MNSESKKQYHSKFQQTRVPIELYNKLKQKCEEDSISLLDVLTAMIDDGMNAIDNCGGVLGYLFKRKGGVIGATPKTTSLDTAVKAVPADNISESADVLLESTLDETLEVNTKVDTGFALVSKLVSMSQADLHDTLYPQSGNGKQKGKKYYTPTTLDEYCRTMDTLLYHAAGKILEGILSPTDPVIVSYLEVMKNCGLEKGQEMYCKLVRSRGVYLESHIKAVVDRGGIATHDPGHDTA